MHAFVFSSLQLDKFYCCMYFDYSVFLSSLALWLKVFICRHAILLDFHRLIFRDYIYLVLFVEFFADCVFEQVGCDRV